MKMMMMMMEVWWWRWDDEGEMMIKWCDDDEGVLSCSASYSCSSCEQRFASRFLLQYLEGPLGKIGTLAYCQSIGHSGRNSLFPRCLFGAELPEYRLFYKVLTSELFKLYKAAHQRFLYSFSHFFSPSLEWLLPVFTSQMRPVNIYFFKRCPVGENSQELTCLNVGN